MSGEEELQDLFRRLARSIAREAGAASERELRAKFRARQNRTKRPWSYVAEIAALLVAVAGLYFALRHGGGTQRPSIPSPVTEKTSGFIMLPYAESGVPMEQPVIVRVRISGAELGRMGMSLAVAPRSADVDADLLIGQDGVARAVRVVE